MSNIFKLVISIVVSESAGLIGSIFTAPAIDDWYVSLIKPAINPPAWVFGPVWTTLFALMGISAFLVWKRGLERKDIKIALGVFIGQLVLNTLWSIIFFGFRSPGGAFIGLVILWLAILATIMAFARISRLAAWLLLPYILWVSFAGYLNYSIWQLNSPKDFHLPAGYSLDTFRIEEVLDQACNQAKQCDTPGEYLVQSRCPFVSLCLKNRCTVVCPGN